MQATNTSGQNDSRLDEGDTIVFTFSEPIDPTSIVAGWDGTGSTNVIIRLSDTQLLEDDEILVYDATNSANCRWAWSTSIAPTTWPPCSGRGTSPTAPPGDSLDDDD